MTSKSKQGTIRVGIGGWNFVPWRGVFYPKGLPHAKELSFAGDHLTAIEINATYYGSQKPESFRKWAAAVPDGFRFSVKASRFATNRRVLREAGDSIKRFIGSGGAQPRERPRAPPLRARCATNRRVLREAGDSIKRFIGSGVTELGDRLGPLLWQFAPFKKFDAADFAGFLALLPREADGHTLRHVVEVRHDSFRAREFIALLREVGVAVVF